MSDTRQKLLRDSSRVHTYNKKKKEAADNDDLIRRLRQLNYLVRIISMCEFYRKIDSTLWYIPATLIIYQHEILN